MTVTKEEGKADQVANGPNTAHPVAEGEGTKEAERGGWINGQPATAKQIETATAERKPKKAKPADE